MEYRFRHTAGGQEVSVIGRTLTLNGQDFALPVGGFSPRVSLDGRVAFAAQEPVHWNNVQVEGGAIWTLVAGTFQPVYPQAAKGRVPAAWHPDGSLHVLVASNGANLTTVLRVERDGSSSTYDIPKWASEGIWKIAQDGSVLLANENTHRVVNGRNLWNWDEDPETGALIGKSDAGSTMAGCVAFTKDHGQSWMMWEPPADLQEPIYVSRGKVAITGFDTPPASGVPWVPLVVAPPPPVVLPAWPDSLPMLVGCLSWDPKPSDPGNLGNVGTDKPVIIEGYRQDNGARWTRNDEDRQAQRLLYLDWKECKAKDAMLANAKADQDQFGGTLVFYFDSAEVAHEPATLAKLREMKGEGRAVAMGLQGYPRPQMMQQLEQDIATYRAEWPVVIFTSGYRQEGGWSVEDAQTAMRLSAQIAAKHRDVVKALVITKRPPFLPIILQDIDTCCALAPATVDVEKYFQKWSRPQPVPPAPVTPPVIVPPTPPKPLSPFLEWLAGRKKKKNT